MKKEFDYDVVIVGSGIAGSVLAKTLTRAGKQVLLVEAGLQAGIALDSEAAYQNYQNYLQTFYSQTAKVPNSPYPNLNDAPSPNVLDIKAKTPYTHHGYLVQLGPLPFASDCLRGPGGTTLHWLGNVPRMLPHDFQMQTRYGKAVDWPITYDDLMPYYDMAENEIGVSGDTSAQVGPDMNPPRNYGPGYVFPMEKIPQSYQDQVWIKRSNLTEVHLYGKRYTINIISMPQGRNSVPNPAYQYGPAVWNPRGKKLQLLRHEQRYQVVPSLWSPYTGERCEGNASCVPICPVQAKYNALKTLKQADSSKLTILTQTVASRLQFVGQDVAPGSKIEAITPIDGILCKVYTDPTLPDHTTQVVTGKIYVLACSAIENAKLLLASNAANYSDQVGRNLMDHLVMLTWGLTAEKVYPYRGPGCTSYIPTFRDGEFRKEFAAWISPIDNWGWAWPTFAPGSNVTEAVGQGMFGKALRAHLSDVIPRQALLHFECEQMPEADNRVTIDPRYLDLLGNYRPVIQYQCSDYMRKSFEAAKTVSDQIFAANQIEDRTVYSPSDADYVTWRGRGYTFRGAGHLVGTHRMGKNRSDSVVNSNGQTWDHPNLYLVGCGNMPTLGTSNPTLTMTALTFKSAEAILQQLEA